MKSAGPMPPHGRIADFLPESERHALLDWAIAQGGAFKPATILYGEGGHQEGVNPDIRVALKHSGLGPFEPLFRERLFARFPEIVAAAGYNGPQPRSIEFELNAYGEGAHFAPHVDIPVGANRRTVGKHRGEDRLISAVYYFFHEPKGFTGGALRLYRFGVDTSMAQDQDSLAFEPVQNMLVVFPSWACHGVETVHCPSGMFQDHRFALNCWFCRRLGT